MGKDVKAWISLLVCVPEKQFVAIANASGGNIASGTRKKQEYNSPWLRVFRQKFAKYIAKYAILLGISALGKSKCSQVTREFEQLDPSLDQVLPTIEDSNHHLCLLEKLGLTWCS